MGVDLFSTSLNKFRGDAALLAPASHMLQELTGIPTVATLLNVVAA
jgi:cobyric acid synthase